MPYITDSPMKTDPHWNSHDSPATPPVYKTASHNQLTAAAAAWRGRAGWSGARHMSRGMAWGGGSLFCLTLLLSWNKPPLPPTPQEGLQEGGEQEGDLPAGQADILCLNLSLPAPHHSHHACLPPKAGMCGWLRKETCTQGEEALRRKATDSSLSVSWLKHTLH